jgi:hypothetical protein
MSEPMKFSWCSPSCYFRFVEPPIGLCR